jgi:hypothetical protein
LEILRRYKIYLLESQKPLYLGHINLFSMTDVSRRKIVTALGVGATVSLAGCNGGQDDTGSEGSDGSDGSGETDGSDGSSDGSSTELPDGFTETGVEDLQTALGEGSAFYNETVIEANFTISQGQAEIENYHYANNDEQVLYQTQTAPARSRENYYRDGTYYVYTSAEGVDPRYSVEEIDWQRSVVYYYPPTSLLTDGELTVEETDEGFQYVTEDVANASLLSQISQLASQNQGGSSGDSEESSDPISEFSAELSFTSEGVPTGFSYTITTESGVELEKLRTLTRQQKSQSQVGFLRLKLRLLLTVIRLPERRVQAIVRPRMDQVQMMGLLQMDQVQMMDPVLMATPLAVHRNRN